MHPNCATIGNGRFFITVGRATTRTLSRILDSFSGIPATWRKQSLSRWADFDLGTGFEAASSCLCPYRSSDACRRSLPVIVSYLTAHWYDVVQSWLLPAATRPQYDS
jgi:hypothetical protein